MSYIYTQFSFYNYKQNNQEDKKMFSAMNYGEILKSPSDTRNYKSIILENLMRVILISDNEAD